MPYYHKMFSYDKLVLRTVLAVALCGCALFSRAEKQPYDRYQPIVDRQMFGALPPGFDPTKPAAAVDKREQQRQEEARKKQEEKIKSAIRFSMCNVTPEGATAVGFTDSSDSKNPRHYYLKVGESRDGWTVKEADPAAATMTIVKNIDTPDAIEVSLTIGGDSGKGAGTTARANRSNVGADHRAAAGAPAGGRDGIMGGSLRSRRMLREQERRQAEEKVAAERAEREKKQAELQAAREARDAEEKAKAAEEREQQRQQLLAIQEELKKAREATAKKESEEAKEEDE